MWEADRFEIQEKKWLTNTWSPLNIKSCVYIRQCMFKVPSVLQDPKMGLSNLYVHVWMYVQYNTQLSCCFLVHVV